ncbi:hypothetical protein DDE82_001492 [Stemphylium lycopersici]|nr:hypothetical protein TW65_08331 [Stemphylium lycopersici]RAR09775.1 hypothetical protein DDE82_001492 [Stemphylium lycopersici]
MLPIRERFSPCPAESQRPHVPSVYENLSIPPPSYRASLHEKPLFDFPGRIEKKLAHYNASQNVVKRWLLEIISVTTSALCMGAVIGLLHYLDDKPLNEWPPGLTVITILSKIASAALILPISEAIGQLKWTWFHGKSSRDAFDFEIFDKASRGAWGSVMLLCRTKVFLLAIDTFFQQVSDLPERWKLQGESFIPRIIRYEPNLEHQYESTLDETPVALTNTELWRGLGPFFYDQNGTRALTTGNATQAEIPLVCPTSRCEWPPYETLGVCSACEDVSHLLEYACITSKLDWIRNATGPGMNPTYPQERTLLMAYHLLTGLVCGYFLNATSEDPILMSGFRIDNSTNSTPGETLLMRTLPLSTNPLRQPLYGGTINFEHVQYRLLDALIVSSVDGSADSVYEKKRPIAQECMLSWCVKTLRSSYESGNYEEETEEIFMNTTKSEWPWRIQNHPEFKTTETEFISNISIRPPSLAQDKAAFGVSNETFLDVVTILDEIFPSMLTISNPTAPPFIKVDTSYVDHVVFRSVRFSPWLAPNNVTRHLERMAQAMTNVIRSNTDSNELVAGTAYVREIYVAVHWAFLTFPLVMLLLSAVFLAATMFKTSGDNHGDIGTWKTSAMPALMYSLPKDMQAQVMGTTNQREMAGKDSNRYRFPERLPRNSLNNGRDTASSPGSTTPKTSLDLTQRLERKLAEYNASQNVFKRWLFEIASWLVSALCMGAIVGIYIRISGQKMVESEQLLTLSNILGKIASAALIVPTSEALGQLKWNWFHESNAMWDFDIFDKASRGPWGAALLLFRTKGRSLAALGALLIVLLLAIDTFFQQVVTYPDQWALSSSSSSIPVVQKYDPPYLTYFQQGFEIGQYDHISGPVVKKYFYENGTQPVFVGRGPRPEIPLSCPSSSCHWPEYDTLATCSSCVEVSERLDITYACLDRAVEWSADWLGPLQDVPYPNATVCGHYLNITSNTPILLAGHVVQDNDSARVAGEALLMRTIPLADFDTRDPYYGNGSISFKNIQYPIFDGLIASAADGVESVYRHEPPVVNECILSWCVQRMKSSYEWGVYSESIQSTFLNIVTDPGTWPWIVNGSDFTYTENITFTVLASEQARPDPDGFDVTYSVWNETAFQIMAIWDDFFPAYYTAKNATSRPRLRFKNYEAGPSTRFLDFNPWLAPNNVSRHYERLATDLTNVIRSNDNSNKMIFGQAFNMEKFVKISWPWLTFPFFLLVLSLVFLVSTIIKTSKDTGAGLWKTSAMPTLIYSLPKETRSKLNPSSELSRSYESSKKLRIKLLPNKGWRVSGASHLSTSPQQPRPAVQAPRGWI